MTTLKTRQLLMRRSYVDVPLEMPYAAAWRGMPQRWRRELEPV